VDAFSTLLNHFGKKLVIWGLPKKNLIENTKIIVFSFKLYPFILMKNKKNFIKGVYEYATSCDLQYKTFINYFKKNWENSSFLNFDIMPNGVLQYRTNNLIEAFHHKINNLVEYNHPRVSILVEKLKDLSIQYYQNYVGKLFNYDNEIKN
jgi:hypothetical protein